VVCREVKRYDGIETVITLVKTGHADAVEHAVTVLINMSTDERLFVDILNLNVIPALIEALSSQLAFSMCLFTVS